MTREEARQYCRNHWESLIPNLTAEATQRVNNRTSWVCPLCGHGSHGDGLTVNPRSADGNGLKCFGCNFSGDIIDLYQKQNSVDYNAALDALAAMDGIVIDQYQPGIYDYSAAVKDFDNMPRSDAEESTAGAGAAAEAPQDLAEYYSECRKRIYDPAAVSYLSARGISVENAAAHGLGYDPKADPAGAGHPTPRIIIPTSEGHYIGRSIDPATDKRFKKLNNAGGKADIFNKLALYEQEAQAIFVVEGAFDALSIIEAGAEAIALNSTSNARMLIEQLKQRRTAATLVISLDNDQAGKTATQELRTGLQRLNIGYVTADICAGYKDPNEALTAAPEAFREAVSNAQRMTAAKPDNTAYYINQLMTGDIERFKADKKTGFTNLDGITGGLYSGLYCIAAISSLGKTTFAAQMADQIAAAGHDVLFFSLEQSRLEMVSKSLARITAQEDMKTAVTSLSIRKGYLPAEVLRAARTYKERVQDRISVIEGNFACNVSFIGDYIRQYIRRTDTRPVVFIDYLQILQPEEENGKWQTAKEVIDNTVTELKRLSREMGLTVFVISSVNRANYLTPIDFESLKESGSIEYTCDVIWGLQLQCLNDPIFDKANNIKERRGKVKEAKAATPRKIELVCLKNRYGIASYSCGFDYYPANDLFIAQADFDTEPQTIGRKARIRI